MVPAARGSRWLESRTGNPANGVYRMVFDLDAGGASMPDVQMGRGQDGNLYLQAAGITVDPAALASFPGAGPVTAITSTGGTGANLKLATTGQPQFSIYYLPGPNRLVIDLKIELGSRLPRSPL